MSRFLPFISFCDKSSIVMVILSLVFYSKGDANESEDNWVITEDMIIGIVNVKIPYLGLHTVWLNEL